MKGPQRHLGVNVSFPAGSGRNTALSPQACVAPKETRSFKHTGSYLIENKTPVGLQTLFYRFKVFIQKLSSCHMLSPATC